MTRAIHLLTVLGSSVGRCGTLGVCTGNPGQITCKRCLKLIGAKTRCPSIGPGYERFRCGLESGHSGSHSALIETSAPWFPREQQPSDPSTARASAVEPVECRETVGVGESHRDFGISLTAQEMLNERADMVRDLREKNAHLEKLLGEIVEACEPYSSWNMFSGPDRKFDRFTDAIEAARRELL